MVRIFGRDVAELPIVATRYKNRGKVGDCVNNLIGISWVTIISHLLQMSFSFEIFLWGFNVKIGEGVSDQYSVSNKLLVVQMFDLQNLQFIYLTGSLLMCLSTINLVLRSPLLHSYVTKIVLFCLLHTFLSLKFSVWNFDILL